MKIFTKEYVVLTKEEKDLLKQASALVEEIKNVAKTNEVYDTALELNESINDLLFNANEGERLYSFEIEIENDDEE